MRAFADHRIARAVRRRTKPTISRLPSADFRSSEGAYSSCAACSASTKLDENLVEYFLRPRFRCPVSGYAFGAARQSFEFGDAAHGLPAGCHSPGVGRTLAVTVSAHAYELARSTPTNLVRARLRTCPLAPRSRRYADVHEPLAEVHRARSHSGLCHRRHRLDDDVDASVRRAARAWKSSLNTESA